MDFSAYINSGVLELYVLDRLSPDERREVERYADQYPEVREEITEIEVALEEYALLRGTETPPPAGILTNVLTAIGGAAATAAAPTPRPEVPSASRRPEVATTTTAASATSNTLSWILAAVLLLAVGGLVYFYLQANNRSESMNEMQQRFTVLQQECEETRASYQSDRQQIALLTDIDTRDVILAGSDNAPDSRALVFYNPSAGEVLFSASNLPAPPTGKQYQLWALDADGQPLDLGVLSLSLTNQQLVEVRYIPDVSAFAITLEDAGGKPTPDLSQLQVIGTVTS